MKRLYLWGSQPALTGVLYLCAYVLLDRYSNVGTFGVAWRPSTGLTFIAGLLQGGRIVPLLFVAPLLSQWINPGLPVAAWTAIAEASVIGGGYALSTSLLRHPNLKFNAALTSLRDILVLLGAAIVSSAAVAIACVGGVLFASGQLLTDDLASVILQYWIGDITGITIVGSFGLLAISRRGVIILNWRAALQVALVALVIAVAIGSAQDEQLQLFFLLFLPITWIAVSAGIEGVGVALLVTQLGLIAALLFANMPVAEVTALQARMAVLAVTALVAGALVTETRNAEQKLRENQAAIARLSRLGSMGELAIAVAHEVNQPLSAAGTYSRLVTESLADENLKDPSIVATSMKATAQVERAAEVIKRLRALVRLGRSELMPSAIEQIIEEALELVRPIIKRSNITVRMEIEKALPPVMVDRIQIGQVLINLLRNAAEAITSAAMSEGRLALIVTRSDAGLAAISVQDSGPGFPPELARAAPILFGSKKTEGLGVGLYLCRSIVESHGGTLHLETTNQGALVRFTLPFAKEDAVHG